MRRFLINLRQIVPLETPTWGDVFPLAAVLRQYRAQDLLPDVLGGLTVVTMLVPQAMAYALLAGLPPIMGLYASIAPLIAYAAFTRARQLTLGPTAITSVLILSVLSPLAPAGTPVYSTYAVALAMTVGAVFLLAGVLRFGWVVNLLSQPVVTGYVNAAALIIAASQVQHLLGIDTPSTRWPHELLLYPLMNPGQINLATVGVSALGVTTVIAFRAAVARVRALPGSKRIARAVPLAVVLGGTLAVVAFGLDARFGVAVVGHIPRGLPSFVPPWGLDLAAWQVLLPGAVAIAFVGFMEDMSTAKTMALRDRGTVHANQELFAMGAANVASALSGAFPVTTSISRSAANHSAGARTAVSTLVAAGVMVLTVTVLTPLFTSIPRASLSVVIVTSVVNLVDFSVIARTWRSSRVEVMVFLLTFVGVLVSGIEIGIFAGILASIGVHLYRAANPDVVQLGRVGSSGLYVPLKEAGAEPLRHTLVLRLDESLFFVNAQAVESQIRSAVARAPSVTHLVLVCSAVNRVESSAILTLEALVDELRAAGVTLMLSELKVDARSRLAAFGFIEFIGQGQVFATTHEAVRTAENERELTLDEYHL